MGSQAAGCGGRGAGEASRKAQALRRFLGANCGQNAAAKHKKRYKEFDDKGNKFGKERLEVVVVAAKAGVMGARWQLG